MNKPRGYWGTKPNFLVQGSKWCGGNERRSRAEEEEPQIMGHFFGNTFKIAYCKPNVVVFFNCQSSHLKCILKTGIRNT